jgi:excisionase family DNA binding protein
MSDAIRERRGLTGVRTMSAPSALSVANHINSSNARPAGKPWSYREAAEALGVCEVTVARAARSGRVQSLRVGRRVFLPDAELRRLQVEGF